jgi:hypothetical protein
MPAKLMQARTQGAATVELVVFRSNAGRRQDSCVSVGLAMSGIPHRRQESGHGNIAVNNDSWRAFVGGMAAPRTLRV